MLINVNSINWNFLIIKSYKYINYKKRRKKKIKFLFDENDIELFSRNYEIRNRDIA